MLGAIIGDIVGSPLAQSISNMLPKRLEEEKHGIV